MTDTTPPTAHTAHRPPRSGRLAGKVALITGAARGIGRATAERFAAEQAHVICADTDADGVHATTEFIAHRGGAATPLVADVRAATALIADAMAVHGRIDVLHANAAAQVMGDLEHTTPQDWDLMYSVNQRAVAESIREVLPHMRANSGGSIILTASLLALTGDPDLAMYGATKGALHALCRAVATAAGPDNIRCNTLCPGDVDTEMVREFFAFQADPEGARRDIEAKYPLRRIAQPHDVANAALFLASDEAAYITGTDIVIDGGLRARIY